MKADFADGDYLILSVTDKLPKSLNELRTLSNVNIHQVKSKTEASLMIVSHHVNLLIVKDDGDWEDVRKLIARARAGKAGSIIVQGEDVHEVGHLRAILAGADSYAPSDDDWTFDPSRVIGEKPRLRLTRKLKQGLSSFGPNVPGAMVRRLQARISAPLRDIDVDAVVSLAAKDVNAQFGKPIAAVTLDQVRQLLDETTVDRPGHGAKPAPPAKTDDELHWNVRFPEDAGILRNKPHVVTTQGEYPFETVIEPRSGVDGFSAALAAAQVRGKTVAYELTATNGSFRTPGDPTWYRAVMSQGTECTAEGTPPFEVTYRPDEEGVAGIDALLLVDGGSVARQTIELRVVGPGRPPGSQPARSQRDPVVVPATAIADGTGADFRLSLTSNVASLGTADALLARAEWRLAPDLPQQLAVVAQGAYAKLHELSTTFVPQRDLSLLGDDGAKSLVELAKLGRMLHQHLFSRPAVGRLPVELRDLAEQLRANGDKDDPLVLQLDASEYPLPWGILYDRPLKAGKNLKPEDVDPNGFWGMRYDIYRDVVPTRGVRAHRGTRCRLKPIVGDTVPLGDQQLEFVRDLGKDVLTGDSLVQDPSSTPDAIQGWAKSGDPSDLLYFYCHAVPVLTNAGRKGPDLSSLVFGPTDQDPARVTLRQLGKWWSEPRSTNPVVILNACASGKSDPFVGAPYVKFFTKDWGAQAFIGTDWPVQATLANVIGRTLLAAVCDQRLSLRKALRSAINAAAAKDNYFPLMYAIYGPSNVQFRAPA